MKTNLPQSIGTIEEAKKFLKELCDNNEQYHPEDDAHDIEWDTIECVGDYPTKEERDQLNKLMNEIYVLKGNEDPQNMIFDPCEFIMDTKGFNVEK